MSMFDDINPMVQDAIKADVAFALLDEWNDSNLDEGTMYADYQICLKYGDPLLQKQFNEFYKMTLTDDLYFEVE